MEEVAVGSKHFADYRSIIEPAAYEELQSLSKSLRGKRIAHVNATSYGGGVRTPAQHHPSHEGPWIGRTLVRPLRNESFLRCHEGDSQRAPRRARGPDSRDGIGLSQGKRGECRRLPRRFRRRRHPRSATGPTRKPRQTQVSMDLAVPYRSHDPESIRFATPAAVSGEI